MKITSYCLSTVFPLLCVTALAQEAPPQPAPQLEKLAPMLGTWEVSGTARETPGAEAQPWTAVQTVRKVLGGHFIRDEMIISTGGPQMAFLSHTGWDNENQRYAAYGASNAGLVNAGELFIIGPSTFVSSMVNIVEGQPVLERAVVKVDGDRYSFEVQQAVGDGPFFTMVQGDGRRTAKEGKATAIDATVSMAPPAPEMALFEKMAGTYAVKGTMIPAPGAPEMAITATETMDMILGGTVMLSHVIGEAEGSPEPYEAFGYLTWNARDKCYDQISVDNMGMGGKSQMRKLDAGTLVATIAAQMYGQPTVSRTILKLDGQGKVSSVAADAIGGAGEPQRIFSATYTVKR